VLVGLVAGWLACALPVDEKTGCFTSDDCVEDRVCDEGHCMSGACGAACLEACDEVDDCGVATMASEDCEAACVSESGLLPAFGPAECKRQWDLLRVEDQCAAVDCLLGCRELCRRAAECNLIVDAAACMIGCQDAQMGCAPAVPSGCADVPAAVQCYEAGTC
jgi:hypothetical protein